MSIRAEEDYYKPVIVGNFCSNNYIEYESKGDRKTLSVKKYLNKIRPYFKYIINNLKKSDTWKIQLTIAIKFLSFKDKDKDNDEERIMHSKRGNIEIMINEVIEELFKSLLNRYQNNMEKLMKKSDKASCIINPDLGGCKNNPENSSTAKSK